MPRPQISHIFVVSDLDGSNAQTVTSAANATEFKQKFNELYNELSALGEPKDIHIYTRTRSARCNPGNYIPVANPAAEEATATLRAELRELEPADLHKIALAEGIDPTGLTDGEIINAIVASTDSAPKDAA